jgi:hypothetical protein
MYYGRLLPDITFGPGVVKPLGITVKKVSKNKSKQMFKGICGGVGLQQQLDDDDVFSPCRLDPKCRGRRRRAFSCCGMTSE